MAKWPRGARDAARPAAPHDARDRRRRLARGAGPGAARRLLALQPRPAVAPSHRCFGAASLPALPLPWLACTSSSLQSPEYTHTPGQIELPVRELLGFSAASQHLSYTYAYRNLRAAFSNIPAPVRGEGGAVSTMAWGVGVGLGALAARGRGARRSPPRARAPCLGCSHVPKRCPTPSPNPALASSRPHNPSCRQVSIDASGLLKVTHMMSILSRPGGPGGSMAPHSASLAPGSMMLSTQVGRPGLRAGPGRHSGLRCDRAPRGSRLRTHPAPALPPRRAPTPAPPRPPPLPPQGAMLDASRAGRVQFVSVPQLDEDDDDGGGGAGPAGLLGP
jgi:hypothetical protein